MMWWRECIIFGWVGVCHSFRTLYRPSRITTATTTTTTASPFRWMVQNSQADSFDSSFNKDNNKTQRRLPSLIVFDLDATIWTPELYVLRRQRQRNPEAMPRAHVDVQLYQGAQEALAWLEEHHSDTIQLAVASRTKSVEWAYDLLDQFGLTHRFVNVQIFSGNKQAHFQNIQQQTGIPFDEMLFFDDSRDGKFGNCVPVSALGVLACHCPGGLDTLDVFHRALDCFHEWDKAPHSIVEWDGRLTQSPRLTGRVKTVLEEKRFGFLEYGDRSTRDLFFHFNDLPPGVSGVQPGDKMTFSVGENRGKPLAQDIQVSRSSAGSHRENQVTLHAFSMNMPFAALVANGYKDLETRNGTMFVPYEEGTKFLLHVGQRTYPDGDRHLEIMKSGGLGDLEIQDLKSLPPGYGRGMAVAILEIGKTYETTVEERSDPDMQRRIGAYGADSGMRCTVIRRVEYLKKPVRVKAQGGVFKVTVDRDVIPEGWLFPVAAK